MSVSVSLIAITIHARVRINVSMESGCLFTDLPIFVPVQHPNNLPLHRGVPDALTEEVEGDCQ